MVRFDWQYTTDYTLETSFHDGFLKLHVFQGTNGRWRAWIQGNNPINYNFDWDTEQEAMKYVETQLGKMLVSMLSKWMPE